MTPEPQTAIRTALEAATTALRLLNAERERMRKLLGIASRAIRALAADGKHANTARRLILELDALFGDEMKV